MPASGGRYDPFYSVEAIMRISISFGRSLAVYGLIVLPISIGCSTLPSCPIKSHGDAQTSSPTANPGTSSAEENSLAQYPPGSSAASSTDGKSPPAPPKTAAQKAEDRKTIGEYNAEMAKAVGLEQARDFNQAREIYLQLVKKCPDRYEAYHRLALVNDEQHKPQDAQDLYVRAIKLQPKNADLLNDLGYSYFLQGKLDKAEVSMRQAVALQPAEPRYHNNLGLVLGNRKKYDAAWHEFRTAGGDGQAFYNLAFIYASQNDFKMAKTCFQKAVAIDPGNQKAVRALQAFELGERDPDSLVGFESTTSDGRPWVAYDENSKSDGANKTASANDNSRNQASSAGNANQRVTTHQFPTTTGSQ
jgi:Tfp pilus assembly protein PilF